LGIIVPAFVSRPVCSIITNNDSPAFRGSVMVYGPVPDIRIPVIVCVTHTLQ